MTGAEQVHDANDHNANDHDAKVHDDIDTLARTLWGEARGDGATGMEAIAATVLNRVERSAHQAGRHWWGVTIAEICRARLQFACWNPASPNRIKILALDLRDSDFVLARSVADRACAGLLCDPTCGATCYKPAGSPWPNSWGHPGLPLATIGGREFFSLDDDRGARADRLSE